MSSTNDDATAASFEALTPPRLHWALLVIVGLVLCILAWFVPVLLRIDWH